MTQPDPVLVRQLPAIKQVIEEEVRREGARRGCEVSPDDPVVRDNVCQTILRIGRGLRETVMAQIAASRG